MSEPETEPDMEPEPLRLPKSPSNTIWLFIMPFIKPWCEKLEPHRQPYTNEKVSDTDSDVINMCNFIVQSNIYNDKVYELEQQLLMYKDNLKKYKKNQIFLLATKTKPIMAYTKHMKKKIVNVKQLINEKLLIIDLLNIKINFLEELIFPHDQNDIRDFDTDSDLVNI